MNKSVLKRKTFVPPTTNNNYTVQTIQEITNIKNVKRCRDGCQKVYTQGMDDSIKAKVNIKAMPHPYTSFSHCSLTDSMLETDK